MQAHCSLCLFADYTSSKSRIRVGEYTDIEFARLLVNLENNCKMDQEHAYHMDCFKHDPANPPFDPLMNPKNLSLLEWLGWTNVGYLDFRGSTYAKSPWLAYTIVAPK